MLEILLFKLQCPGRRRSVTPEKPSFTKDTTQPDKMGRICSYPVLYKLSERFNFFSSFSSSPSHLLLFCFLNVSLSCFTFIPYSPAILPLVNAFFIPTAPFPRQFLWEWKYKPKLNIKPVDTHLIRKHEVILSTPSTFSPFCKQTHLFRQFVSLSICEKLIQFCAIFVMVTTL